MKTKGLFLLNKVKIIHKVCKNYFHKEIACAEI